MKHEIYLNLNSVMFGMETNNPDLILNMCIIIIIIIKRCPIHGSSSIKSQLWIL